MLAVDLNLSPTLDEDLHYYFAVGSNELLLRAVEIVSAPQATPYQKDEPFEDNLFAPGKTQTRFTARDCTCSG